MTGALKDVGGVDVDAEASRLNQLRTLMNSPGSNPGKVAELAQAAAKEFETSLQQVRVRRYDASEVARLLRDVVDSAQRKAPASWDQAAQEYLAVAALYHGLTDLNPGRRDPVLRNSIEALVKPIEPPSLFVSPVLLDPEAYRAQMQIIHRRLAGR
jgi:hypothetical protein